MTSVEDEGEQTQRDHADDQRVGKSRWKPSVNSGPSWGTPIRAATLTMLTLLTAATRSPAAMTGTASGQVDGEEPPHAAGRPSPSRQRCTVLRDRAEPVGDGAHEQRDGVDRHRDHTLTGSRKPVPRMRGIRMNSASDGIV